MSPARAAAAQKNRTCPACQGMQHQPEDEHGRIFNCLLCDGDGDIAPGQLYDCMSALCGTIVTGETLMQMNDQKVPCRCGRQVKDCYAPLAPEEYPQTSDEWGECVWDMDEIASHQEAI